MSTRPPEILRRLLEALLPRGHVREGLVGDLDELYADHARRGRIRAVAWYLRQLASAAVRYRGGRSPGLSTQTTPFAGLGTDIRVGARLLVKYPGLSIVSGLAMAFAIFVGVVVFEIGSLYVSPSLPLPDGERIVQINSWDVEEGRAERRLLLDFEAWRSSITTIGALGAWRDVRRSLAVQGVEGPPVEVAEISATGLRVAGAVPAIGRTLTEDDERAGAPPVAVIGFDVWRTRFGRDPGVVGRVASLGDQEVTVVGVMSEGFEFPVAHDVWVPLRTEGTTLTPRSGPPIRVVGLLSPDASLDAANAELEGLALRMADQFPASHGSLRPRATPYIDGFSNGLAGEVVAFTSIGVLVVLLVLLVCSNVALLLFARAAARESELLVRSAVGAGRRRIVTQMFLEALVLGIVAAGVGLVAASSALSRWVGPFLEFNEGRLPFWMDPHLSPRAVVFALGLTVIGSAVAGILPGLKVTRGMALRLRQAAAGSGGLQFGGVWTAVIVLQVAVTVAIPSVVYFNVWQMRHTERFEAGFAAEQYLTARLDRGPSSAASEPGEAGPAAGPAAESSFAATVHEVRERLEGEPGVLGATVVSRVPRTGHPDYHIEVEGGVLPAESAAGSATYGQAPEVELAHVGPAYFDVIGAPVLAGRVFDAGDLSSGERVAIVDESFVDLILAGRNAVGRRVRFLEEAPFLRDDGSEQWFEIVGVVPDLGMGRPSKRGPFMGLYLPMVAANADRVHLMIRTRGDPMTLAPAVRAIVADVDPSVTVDALVAADDVLTGELSTVRLMLYATVLLNAIALLLSLSGIYSVLAFTVARRTREIGLRAALGGGRRRIFVDIFRGPLSNVGAGVAAGSLLILAGLILVPRSSFSMAEELGGGVSLSGVGLLVAYAAFMFGICLLACVVPTRRALSVEPTEALRTE